MNQEKKMDLLEFARMVESGQDFDGERYVDLMRRVLPLDSLRDLSPEESEWLLMSVTWLYDYSLLLWEFKQVAEGNAVERSGYPMVPGSNGPFIENLLTRSGKPDFSQLENFGVPGT